jgi:hypothetical protein
LSVHLLQAVPEEEIWLAGQRSPHTRRAYKQDVSHFISVMGIRSADELRHVTADYAAKRRILEIVFLNCRLDDVTLVPTIRKHFDVLTEGLSFEKCRGERI